MKLIQKIYFAMAFVAYYFFKLAQANLYIASDLITPGLKTHATFVKVPLLLNSEAGLLLFSNLVSMTPGSLSIDMDSHKKFMVVHLLYSRNREVELTEFEAMQKKIKRIIE